MRFGNSKLVSVKELEPKDQFEDESPSSNEPIRVTGAQGTLVLGASRRELGVRTWKSAFALRSVALLTVFGIWSLLSLTHAVSAIFLPSPSHVWSRFVQMFLHGYQGHSLLADLWASGFRVFIGLGGAVLLGAPVGLAMGYSQTIRGLVDPLIQMFRPIPPLAYLTLLIIWFGIGNEARILLLYLAGFPVIAIGSMQAALSVPKEKISVAQSMGASRRQIWMHVIVQSARADVMSTIRVATGVVFTTLVAAEMIAANTGLGAIDLNASRYFQSDVMFVAIILLGVMGVALDLAIQGLDRIVVPWRGRV